MALLRWQVRLGPRPAGSRPARVLAAKMARLLPDGRVERGPGGVRNVVGRLPGRLPAIVVGAHYDTKDVPGNVGANDGASGVAVVVELARALRSTGARRGREIRFVLFDAEESPRGSDDFHEDGLRGSRAYVARHRSEVGAAIVVDMIGDADLSIPREAGSDARLWARLRASARRVGALRAFPARTRGEILDDHTAFTERGIRAIDVIDFTYPPWHTARDTLSQVSPASLDTVGETLADLVPRLANRPLPKRMRG
jgi:Zn-dependent M28 family amino/carboxypeptidase